MVTKTTHTLDYNGLYKLNLEYDAAADQLRVSLSDENHPWPRFRRTTALGLEMEHADKAPVHPDNTVTFNHVPRGRINLRLDDQLIGSYRVENGALQLVSQRKLTSSETRRIGTFYRQAPYPILRGDEQLVERARHAVFTDFHTHSSGQISAKGIIEVGMKHHAYYPLHLLKEAGIDIAKGVYADPANIKKVKRVKFSALEPQDLPDMVDSVDLNAIPEADLKKLELKMSMAADAQATFTEMEYDAYRFRYPLSKNKDMFRDSWVKVAEEYAEQGIKYAEIATVGLDDPDLLTEMHKAMEDIAKNPKTKDVTLKFLLAIPRTWSQEKIEETLEKAKVLSASPYIMGIDFVGYESNKTAKFKHAVDEFAHWANDNRPGFTLRAHAGENDKNLENVREFLEVGLKYPDLHVRIGHGIYGMNKETIEIAKTLSADPENPRVAFEYNPSSNIALNNVDDVRQIPFRLATQYNIPFVVGSDSSGIYQTTGEQLGVDAYFAGLDGKGFDMLQKHQEHLVDRQMKYAASIATQGEWDFGAPTERSVAKLVQQLAQVPKAVETPRPRLTHAQIAEKLKDAAVRLITPDSIPQALKDRTPVTIVGASGNNWKRITKEEQKETAIMVDLFAHTLDPSKTYFVQGRTKSVGLSAALNHAISDANAENKASGKGASFQVLGLLAEPDFTNADEFSHLTHLMEISRGGANGSRLDIAEGIVQHTFQHNGTLIAAGGAAFTRDIILKADRYGIRDNDPDNKKMLLLLSGPEGASTEKAAVLHPDFKCLGAIHAITTLHNRRPDLFQPGFDINHLEALYKESAQRVEKYGIQEPNTEGQVVDAAVTLGQEKGKQ